MTDNLKSAVSVIIDEAHRMSGDQFADALAAIADELATGERDDDLFAEAVIDSIRWGERAGVFVELMGGAMLRVVLPGGARITHEWSDADDADPQIKAALAAVVSEMTAAEGVGDDAGAGQ